MAKAAPKQFLFVSNRDQVIGSTSGHSIRFEKGKPTHVPRVMHEEVLNKGCVQCDGDAAPLPVDETDALPEKPKVLLAPDDADERAEAIKAVMEQVRDRNSSADFTAGGVPSAAALTAALGWKVDAKEIRPLWNRMKSDAAQAA
jgi:hypothetical protein